MVLQAFLLILSIVILYFGAEFTLESAEKIGKYFKLSPLVIGMILIGFGTSLPEFFVSQIACYQGHPEMALGNIIGSNIANLLLILGITGLMVPLALGTRELKKQTTIHVGVTGTLVYLLFRPKFDIISGVILTIVFVTYLTSIYLSMKKYRKVIENTNQEEQEIVNLTFKDMFLLVIGFAMLYAGGELLVTSGSALGKIIGISDFVIAAIFVAFGTSFPELITALMACFKKKDIDIITGNIIGSNVFNVAFVLGSVSFYEFDVVKDYSVESIILISATLLLMILSFLNKKFNKLSGALFLAGYIGTVIYWTR